MSMTRSIKLLRFSTF